MLLIQSVIMLKIYVFLNKIFGIFKYIHDTCRHVHIQSFINFWGGGAYAVPPGL